MERESKSPNEASEEEILLNSHIEERNDLLAEKTREGKMRKSFTWFFMIAAIVVIFMAFNYQGGQDAIPLSEIFPDEQSFPGDVDYEFVQEESNTSQISNPIEVAEQEISTTVVDHGFNFTVQIASFKDKKKSEEALSKIQTQVPAAYISTHDLGAKGVWHRIYAGQYELRSDAEVALSDIKQNYNNSFIISPKKAD